MRRVALAAVPPTREAAPDPDHPGYAYVFAYSSKLQSEVMLAIPPKGAKWVGPKIRVIR